MAGKEESRPIYEKTQSCHRLFKMIREILSKRATNQGARSIELVLDCTRRFQFWTGSVGVDTEPRLDTRLLDDPDLRDEFLKALGLIESNLKQMVNLESTWSPFLHKVLRIFYVVRGGDCELSPASEAALSVIYNGLETLDKLADKLQPNTMDDSDSFLEEDNEADFDLNIGLDIEDENPPIGPRDRPNLNQKALDRPDRVVNAAGQAAITLDPMASQDISPEEDHGVQNLQRLRQSIEQAFVESALDRKEFLPRSSFETIVAPDVVRHTIGLLSEERSNSAALSEFAAKQARKSFAILVVIANENIISALESLRMHGFTDGNLPIPQLLVGDRDKMRDADKHLDFARDQPWNEAMLGNFFNEQWKFLAPVFGQNFPPQDLPSRSISPIVEMHPFHSSLDDNREVRIHPSHLKGQQPHNFLIVRGRRQVQETTNGPYASSKFQTELQNISARWKLSLQNLHTANVFFSRGQQQYVLLPWADGGTLQEFWQEHNSRPLDPNLVSESLQQLGGLVDALLLMEAMEWRQWQHEDLTPLNILVFMKTGTRLGAFKLSYLPRTRGDNEGNRRQLRPNSDRLGSSLHGTDQGLIVPSIPRSNLDNVRSMGHIFSKFITWLLDGRDLLHESDNEVRGGEPYPRDALRDKSLTKYDEAVHMYLGRLLKHDVWAPGTSLGDLVHVVLNDMLLVDSPNMEGFNKATKPMGWDPLRERLERDQETVLLKSSRTSLTPKHTALPASTRSDASPFCSETVAVRDYLKDINMKAQRDGEYLFPSHATRLNDKEDEDGCGRDSGTSKVVDE